jgi:hypothetical protein
MAQDTKKRKVVLKPRPCRYCRVKFVPGRPQDKDAKFCQPNHRKAYWRYGGLRFDKFKAQLMKELKSYVREEVQRVAALIGLATSERPKTEEAEKEFKRMVREELSRLLASLGQSTP